MVGKGHSRSVVWCGGGVKEGADEREGTAAMQSASRKSRVSLGSKERLKETRHI